MENILHCFHTQAAARNAFLECKEEGTRRTPQLTIDSEGKRRFFRRITTLEDVHTMAGIALTCVYGLDYLPVDLQGYLKTLIRAPLKEVTDVG
jgi:hypothetical protein